MKSTIFILISFILVSCASQKTSNRLEENSKEIVGVDYSTSISKLETNKEFELLVRNIMQDKNISIDEKTALLEKVKQRIKFLSEKKDYINEKLKVDAKLTVEMQTRIGELSGSINNLGNKVITQMTVLISSSDEKVKNIFPMRMTLTASDDQLNKFKFNQVISDVPSSWSKELTITVEDATFLNK